MRELVRSGSFFHAPVLVSKDVFEVRVMLEYSVKVLPEQFFAFIVNAAECRAFLCVADIRKNKVKVVIADSADSNTISCRHKPEPYIIICCAYSTEGFCVYNVLMQRMSRVKHSADSCELMQI